MPRHRQRKHAHRQRTRHQAAPPSAAEIRADVERAGGMPEFSLITATEDAADKLETQARETGDIRIAIVAAMVRRAMHVFDDPAHWSPCIMCSQRLSAGDVAHIAIAHAHANQPQTGLGCFICAECARQYPTVEQLENALEPIMQRQVGGRLSRVVPRKIKCGRTACRRRSGDPKADGWIWAEAGSKVPLRGGWWCPQCVERLQELFAKHGVEPVIEPLS